MSTVSENFAPKVLVPIANGTEEIEAVTIIDTLVRAGAHVTTATVSNERSLLAVTCSRGVKLVGDKHIDDCIDESSELIACPGGMPGATNLRDSDSLRTLLVKQSENNKLIGAICASPAVILAHHGLIGTKSATCYPVAKFTTAIGGSYSNAPVVVDGTLVTSQGPGTSLLFSLKLVEILFGPEKARLLNEEMIAQF
eukprot:gene29923-39094_t